MTQILSIFCPYLFHVVLILSYLNNTPLQNAAFYFQEGWGPNLVTMVMTATLLFSLDIKSWTKLNINSLTWVLTFVSSCQNFSQTCLVHSLEIVITNITAGYCTPVSYMGQVRYGQGLYISYNYLMGLNNLRVRGRFL